MTPQAAIEAAELAEAETSYRHQLAREADAAAYERGHGLTMATLHDGGCCAEWAAGEASTPARAEAFREVAARWGSSWPKEPEQEAEAGL